MSAAAMAVKCMPQMARVSSTAPVSMRPFIAATKDIPPSTRPAITEVAIRPVFQPISPPSTRAAMPV